LLLSSFEPQIASHSTVLILGSMPGQESLRLNQYYAHRRNLFWKIMSDLVGINMTATYDERLRHLRRTGIALWDSLMHCERPGSRDADIVAETEVPNDFPKLLADYPTLRAICFNGKKSEQVFRRRVLSLIPDAQLQKLVLIGLPSTSPANAGLTYEQKLARWRVILQYLPTMPLI
jgi:double-stranded uracil-DNA glycosylase